MYYFGEIEIPSVSSIRDLGITISGNFKFHEHIQNIVSTASKTCNMIHRCFTFKSKTFLMDMFKSFARPQLEYASQVWNPLYLGDIKLIESVQRRYTKGIPGLYDHTYGQRLQSLEIDTLEFRRLKQDLIFAFKLIRGYLNVDYKNFFKIKVSQTRGHQFTIIKEKFKKDVRKHFFTIRVVNAWNSLPADAVNAPNLIVFKKWLSTDSARERLKPFLRGEAFEV